MPESALWGYGRWDYCLWDVVLSDYGGISNPTNKTGRQVYLSYPPINETPPEEPKTTVPKQPLLEGMTFRELVAYVYHTGSGLSYFYWEAEV